MISALRCKCNNLVKDDLDWVVLKYLPYLVYFRVLLIPLSSEFYRSKLYTYDDVVERVAQQLGLDDSSKIRLTSHNCYSQQPKPQPIKYRGMEHLSDMLVHYNQVIFSGLGIM